jgi:hypothetical protein
LEIIALTQVGTAFWIELEIIMDNKEQRIVEILGEDSFVDSETVLRYREYLRSQLSFPIVVTGIEDFPWEERYVIGGWDPKEYEELKKINPSYTDDFELTGIDEIDNRNDIFALITRIADRKEFEIGLSWLKCKNTRLRASRLLGDYSYWHANY